MEASAEALEEPPPPPQPAKSEERTAAEKMSDLTDFEVLAIRNIERSTRLLKNEADLPIDHCDACGNTA